MYNRNIIATLILLVLDFAWLYGYMGAQYRRMIPQIQGSEMLPRMEYAVSAYALMVLGLNIFVLPNIRSDHALEDSFKYGFTFGVVLYGVYDFTAAAVLQNWDIRLALIDILWGGTVYFLAAYLSTKALEHN